MNSLPKDDSFYSNGSRAVNLVTVGQVRGKHYQLDDANTQVTATATAPDDRESRRRMRVQSK